MRAAKLDRDKLHQMIEEATIDCHDISEQATGLFTMLSDNLAVPFTTSILGREVTVTAVDMAEDDSIFAVCVAGQARQRIAILDLPLPEQQPNGAEWIEAYRLWSRSMGQTD
jgi:hypothetical protein